MTTRQDSLVLDTNVWIFGLRSQLDPAADSELLRQSYRLYIKVFRQILMGLEGEVSQQCCCIYGETCTLSVEGYVLMPTMVIDIPAEIYKQLEAQARQAGTTPERFTRKLLETALHTPEKPKPQTIREVLQATGRVRPLSDALRRQIIPGVTLDEVRKALSQSAGPSLSDVIDEQRGPKA